LLDCAVEISLCTRLEREDASNVRNGFWTEQQVISAIEIQFEAIVILRLFSVQFKRGVRGVLTVYYVK